MTSRDRITSVDTVLRILHRVYCLPGAKPDATWSDGHTRVDRMHAIEVYDGLVAAGLVNAPVSISDDFLAVS